MALFQETYGIAQFNYYLIVWNKSTRHIESLKEDRSGCVGLTTIYQEHGKSENVWLQTVQYNMRKNLRFGRRPLICIHILQ